MHSDVAIINVDYDLHGSCKNMLYCTMAVTKATATMTLIFGAVVKLIKSPPMNQNQ